MLSLKQIGMSASLQKQERQLGVVLFSSHEPVGLDVALPNLPLLVHEFVWTVLSGERASFLKYGNSIMYEPHVQTSFLTENQVLFETLWGYNFVLHILMPNSLNKSSTES